MSPNNQGRQLSLPQTSKNKNAFLAYRNVVVLLGIKIMQEVVFCFCQVSTDFLNYVHKICVLVEDLRNPAVLANRPRAFFKAF